MSIRIVTDSTCDLTQEDRARLNVTVVPLHVHFGEKSYIDDGVQLPPGQFFEKLQNSQVLPTTSQVTPQAFVEVFREHLEAGDDVVGIFISSGISGTYQSAVIAKEELDNDKLSVIDSQGATVGLALLVAEAAKLRDAGLSAAEIVERITALKEKVRFYAILNTLKYLKKGGRISGTSAVIGGILGIKPIITMTEGKIETAGKERGMASAIGTVLDKTLADPPDFSYPVAFTHTCVPDELAKMKALYMDTLKTKDSITCNIGPVIGTYAGTGALGFAYVAKNA